MANEKNLIPFSERSEAEARELGRKGGVASGATRRRKRSLKEAADLFLSLEIRDKKELKALEKLGLASDQMDQQMAMIAGLTAAAKLGDARAAKVVIELLDEKHNAGKLDKLDALLEEFKNAIESEAD